MTNFRRIKRMTLDETEEMVRLIVEVGNLIKRVSIEETAEIVKKVVEAGCQNPAAKNCEGCIFDKIGICGILPGDDVKEWLTSEADEG